MARKSKAAKAGRTTSGRFKRTKSKNMTAARAGRKGHRASCKRHR